MKRKIIIDGMSFEWKVGRSFIVIRGGDVSKAVPLWRFLGISPTEFERNSYEGNQIPITPARVERYIKTNLIPKI